MGFESAQIQQRKTTHKKSVPLAAWIWQPPMLHLNVALLLKIYVYHQHKMLTNTDLLPTCYLVNGHVLSINYVYISETWVSMCQFNIPKIHILIIMHIKCWNGMVYKSSGSHLGYPLEYLNSIAVFSFCTHLTFDLNLRLGRISRLGIHPHGCWHTSRNTMSMDATFYPILPSEECSHGMECELISPLLTSGLLKGDKASYKIIQTCKIINNINYAK